MINPDNPVEIREMEIVMHPNEPPVPARVLIEWVSPAAPPEEPSPQR